MNKKKALLFKHNNADNYFDEFDYEKYCELAENGLGDSEIAREMNISEKLLKNLKKEAEEYY